MDRRRIAVLTSALVALAAVIGGGVWWRQRYMDLKLAVIPAAFLADLPPNCRQVLLVLSPEISSVNARLWLMEKDPQGQWAATGHSIPVSLGRSGLAWGLGEHHDSCPEGWPTKLEGDGCSPAGVFRIPFAFGYAPGQEASWLRLPYRPVTDKVWGVDDPRSRYYNQVVDERQVTPDWESSETMLRPDGLYQWGAFVAHNPACTPDAGSCIFLHLWRGPGQPTAGCTAMDDVSLRHVLAWLDPAQEPRLVQGPEK